MIESLIQTDRPNLPEDPKWLTRRSLIVALVMGFFITFTIGNLNVFGRTHYYIDRFPRDGHILIDKAGRLRIGRLEDWDLRQESTYMGPYMFRDREYTQFKLILPIIKKCRRELTYMDDWNNSELILTSDQIKELRQEISIVYLTDGDLISAANVLLPDRIVYRVVWLNLLGNTLWIVVASGGSMMVSFLIRSALIRVGPQDRRRRAILNGWCPSCGYDTRLLPQRRCPECGEIWGPVEGESAHPY